MKQQTEMTLPFRWCAENGCSAFSIWPDGNVKLVIPNILPQGIDIWGYSLPWRDHRINYIAYVVCKEFLKEKNKVTFNTQLRRFRDLMEAK